ncbi:MAG: SDR family oxidoreductase [Rubellimicrobium sp.]|nr:SDR family oxidoreductase [Rubellimicrobium sp.]
MAGLEAVVIGGGHGAGLALVRGLTDAGASVLLTAPDEGTATTLARSLGQEGRGCDPADDAALALLAGHVQAARPPADLVAVSLGLNGAATGDPAAFAAGIVTPVMAVLHHFAPPMQARGRGAFLLLLTLPPDPDPFAEGAAGWLSAITRTCAGRWAADGVRANAVVALVQDAPALPRFMAARAPAAAPPPVPLGMLPRMQDVAAAALALCAPAAAAMSGQVVRLDGGRRP